MDRLNKFIRKVCTKEIIFYGLFGVLTTIINIGVFYILVNLLHLNENFSNIIAIIVAVLVAYFTNRKLVFNSTATTFNEKLSEFYKFILGRLFTMGIEMLGFFLLFNLLHIHELISKCVITIIVIILNYFISKFFAFKKH